MAEGRDDHSLPAHLEALFDDPDSELRSSVERAMSDARNRLTTGRVGRAFALTKLAVGGGGRALLGRARDSLAGEDRDAAAARRGRELALQMVTTLSEMRGIAMKMGQMLSYLDTSLPPEARKVLAVLQRDAPAMDFDRVSAQLESELGRPVDELFSYFSREPIAAASIGQVHRAVRTDGREVAVKIQYPGIAEAMAADLENAKVMSLFQRLLFFRTNTTAIMAEIEERLIDECDYQKEAEYQETFRALFANHPWIVIPAVHHDLSTAKVLTTDFEHGATFYEWLASDPSDEVRARVTRVFYRFYIGSLYMDGLFNCDPHPGNYLFRDDGRVVFLDHGCTRRFDDTRRELWTQMCLAVHADDREALEQLAHEVGFIPEGVDYDYDAYRSLIRYLYQAYLVDAPFDFSNHPPQDTFRRMFLDNPNLFKLDMPADAVFLNRITFGLVSLLAEMGSTLNCYRYSTAYFEGRDPDWPEDPRLSR